MRDNKFLRLRMTAPTIQDEHFKGDTGKEIVKKLDKICNWGRSEASWIQRDRFLERRWWNMIDSIEVVVMRLQSYEKKEKGKQAPKIVIIEKGQK